MTRKRRTYQLCIEAPVNGRLHKATITAKDPEGGILFTDKADLAAMQERSRLAARFAKKLDADAATIEEELEKGWAGAVSAREQEQRAQRDAAAAPDEVAVEVLDAAADAIRRPLCLVADRAYAAAWLSVQTTRIKTVNRETGATTTHEPPLVRTEAVLAVVRDDGQVFLDNPSPIRGAEPLSRLGVDVALPVQPPADRTWSGAGVKRYFSGERPNPAEVFSRVAGVVNRFMDFARSLGQQQDLCELVACYVLATYLLDAFHVVGYLWPNGERGAGKTTFLQVVAELAHLGQVILAGGSYASLRDLADYGATLCFDDAEGIMDHKRTDPDKRALLLAGNRRGATVTVKELAGEQWVTRYINTFCPRLFSAIRLPDAVLGSRTITIPLVRSGDPRRAKANPLDHSSWPHERRRLVDDLWALGLANLPQLRAYDTRAAEASPLAGRDLEPWRGMLAVAAWLQEEHRVQGVYDRMAGLSASYQAERDDLEAADSVRVLVRALQQLAVARDTGGGFTFEAGELAVHMNSLAADEGLSDDGKDFTSPRKVGWALKRQRFSRESGRKNRTYRSTAAEVQGLARAYGVDAGDGRGPTAPPPGDEPETF